MLAKKVMCFYSKSCFLSNFFPAGFRTGGKRYATVEHYFQSQKTNGTYTAERIRLAETPYRAKQMGKAVLLRPNWEKIKEEVMMQGLKLKFANPIMRARLLQTGNAKLVEDSPYDFYWGGRTGGLNRLGILLMRLRKELQDGSQENEMCSAEQKK